MDNRKLTSTVEQFFSDTQKAVNNIMTKSLKDEKKVAKTLTH